MINQYQIPAEKIVILHSDSNTKGNALAVVQYFSEDNIQNVSDAGLLTSFWHLPRATRMFIDNTDLRLIPICAEAVIYEAEFENIQKFYTEEGLSRIVGAAKNDLSEIRGMSDQEKGSYTPQFK